MRQRELAPIIDKVDQIMDRAKRLYIGRTYFPEARLLQHRAERGFNKLFSLHWNTDLDEIAALEERLIAEFGGLEPVENSARKSSGAWHDGPNAVYVAWTWRGRGGDQLIDGRRAREILAVPPKPAWKRYLFTPLTQAEAAMALAERP